MLIQYQGIFENKDKTKYVAMFKSGELPLDIVRQALADVVDIPLGFELIEIRQHGLGEGSIEVESLWKKEEN